MKICEFCGSVNADNSEKCASCGSSTFKYKCNNCGAEFQQGVYCPHCGVKAGQQPRVCPVCQTQYYSNACPTCGYVPQSRQPVQPAAAPVYPTAPPKKRKTWLWVLGWIFIFPVPLTIIIAKSNMKKGWKIALIIALWTVIVLIGSLSNKDEAHNRHHYAAPPSPASCSDSYDG